jgi:hypothetical protein
VPFVPFVLSEETMESNRKLPREAQHSNETAYP